MTMRRAGAALTIFLGIIGTTLVGCGGRSTDEDTRPVITGGKSGSAATAKQTGIPSGKGVLKGRVTVEGDLSGTIAKLNTELTDKIDKAADKSHCMAGDASADEKQEQIWKVSPDGDLANAFVILRPAKGTFFELKESDAALQNIKKHPDLVLDQPHCAFIPHALVVFPKYRNDKNEKVDTGQKFTIKNSSKIGHNTKYPEGNPILPSGATLEVNNLDPKYAPISFSCNVHPWMNADAWVLDHPYFAITDKDGNFEIKNVPAGDVQIIVWHGGAEYLTTGKNNGEKITLTDKETVKDFTAKSPK